MKNRLEFFCLFFLIMQLYCGVSQQDSNIVNCYDIIKTEYKFIYDSLGNILHSDTIVYIRACTIDECNINEILLRKKILIKGSNKAYWNYRISSGSREFSNEYLFYTFIMAFKYNDGQAYYDLMSSYRSNFYKENFIDENTINQMIFWIKKAARSGHKQSREMLKKYSIYSRVTLNEKIKLLMQ